MIGWIILGIIVGVIGYVIVTYNSFVKLNQYIQNAWADIEVLLKRRYNLIPALVESVKGYSKYEQETLKKVIEARNGFENASSLKEKINASNNLNKTLGSIFALAEAYPDLKANSNFINLQNELANTENKISQARRYFNATIREYNTKVNMFPSNIIAQKFGFDKLPYFELNEEEKENVSKMPKIDL
jgi:LemA protein